MVVYRYLSNSVVAERSYLYLVSELDALREKLVELLAPEYELKWMTPREILSLSAREKEETLTAAAATLVDWSEESPAVILALKDTAHRKAVPLVALCGPNQAEHVAALVVGADDTLTRPLKPILFQARLMAYRRLLAHTQRAPEPAGDGMAVVLLPGVAPPIPDEHDVAAVGPLTLDRTAKRFFIHSHLEALPPRAFDLMEFLMRRVGVCHTRDDMLNQVWGIDYETDTNILDVQIYTLRRKLKAYGLEDMIETVRGVGYRLVEPCVQQAAHPGGHTERPDSAC